MHSFPTCYKGGPSALGKKYVDTKFEVTFGCKFILWPRPATELWIWWQQISFPKQKGHPVLFPKSKCISVLRHCIGEIFIDFLKGRLFNFIASVLFSRAILDSSFALIVFNFDGVCAWAQLCGGTATWFKRYCNAMMDRNCQWVHNWQCLFPMIWSIHGEHSQ